MRGDEVLRLENVTAGYGGIPVVRDINLSVQRGEVVALLGSNGAGKTTTLLTISGLVSRLGGAITVLNAPVHTSRTSAMASVWRMARVGVAHVPEDRGLFFDLTAAENLLLGRRRSGPVVSMDQILSWFPALERVLDRVAGLLSGGEQQMLALARAVVGSPKLLLVDELSLGLAPIVVSQLLPVLRSIATDTGAGILVVEQHVSLVLDIADRAYLLSQGVITFDGPAAELRARPDLVEASYLGASTPPGASDDQ